MGEGTEWVMGVSQLQETWKRPYLTDAPVLLVVCHEVRCFGPLDTPLTIIQVRRMQSVDAN